jgi:hypothetical protein
MTVKQKFKAVFREEKYSEVRVFEFPDEAAFFSALQLFSWATSFFLDDSCFTSERVTDKKVSKRRLCPDDEHATSCGPDLDADVQLRLETTHE